MGMQDMLRAARGRRRARHRVAQERTSFCGVRAPADADGAPADFDLAFRVARYRGRVRPSLLLASPLLLTPAARAWPPLRGTRPLRTRTSSRRRLRDRGSSTSRRASRARRASVWSCPRDQKRWATSFSSTERACTRSRRAGDAWVAPACRSRCTVRYALDLEPLAAPCRPHGLRCGASATRSSARERVDAPPRADGRGRDARRRARRRCRVGSRPAFAGAPPAATPFGRATSARRAITAFGDFRRMRGTSLAPSSTWRCSGRRWRWATPRRWVP